MFNSPAFRASLLTILEAILGPDSKVGIEEDGQHVTIDYPNEPQMKQDRMTVHDALTMSGEMMRDRYADDV
jgi:hypothetical protein